MAKFPKMLWAKYEEDANGPDYLVVHRDPINAAELGKKITLGLYVLRELREVEGVINEHKKPARR